VTRCVCAKKLPNCPKCAPTILCQKEYFHFTEGKSSRNIWANSVIFQQKNLPEENNCPLFKRKLDQSVHPAFHFDNNFYCSEMLTRAEKLKRHF
jgi:hypothetical protein